MPGSSGESSTLRPRPSLILAAGALGVYVQLLRDLSEKPLNIGNSELLEYLERSFELGCTSIHDEFRPLEDAGRVA